MGIFIKTSAWDKEWNQVMNKERRFLKSGSRKKESFLDKKLSAVVPDGLKRSLDTAFFKAFTLIFEKGTALIEKTCRKEDKERICRINQYAVGLKADRKSLSAFRRQAGKAGNKNLLLSGVEGIGLGILGIGLGDIPLFTGMILKSLYETAISYGYSYEQEPERLFLLRLIEVSLTVGEELAECTGELEVFMRTGCWENCQASVSLDTQTERTARRLSGELLYMKFLQGIPIAGIVGGLYDAVYLQRIQLFAGIQYQKRFLIDQKNQEAMERKNDGRSSAAPEEGPL